MKTMKTLVAFPPFRHPAFPSTSPRPFSTPPSDLLHPIHRQVDPSPLSLLADDTATTNNADNHHLRHLHRPLSETSKHGFDLETCIVWNNMVTWKLELNVLVTLIFGLPMMSCIKTRDRKTAEDGNPHHLPLLLHLAKNDYATLLSLKIDTNFAVEVYAKKIKPKTNINILKIRN
ncbi:hypothetical protein L1887_18022 [Cichorium endivia]|nr:hypothetical protein L1887_18022 [Cichorium endivia]